MIVAVASSAPMNSLPPNLPDRPVRSDRFARRAWDRYRSWATWVQILVGAFVVLFAVSAAAAPFQAPKTATREQAAPEVFSDTPTPAAPQPSPTIDKPPPPPPPTVTPKPKVTPNPQPPKREPAPEVEPECDPNYSGACLKPNVEDYDCADGSGNGPYYIDGPFRRVGSDPYDLDRDNDGIACE
jgi:hypothetical protein